MAADTTTAGSAANAGAEETLESLLREAEALKQRLEEERQKLNDVTRECGAVISHLHLNDLKSMCFIYFMLVFFLHQ